jgi:hypothetical protein
MTPYIALGYALFQFSIRVMDCDYVKLTGQKIRGCFSVRLMLETVEIYSTYSFYSATQLIVINPTLVLLKREVLNQSLHVTMKGRIFVIEKLSWLPFT